MAKHQTVWEEYSKNANTVFYDSETTAVDGGRDVGITIDIFLGEGVGFEVSDEEKEAIY